MKQLIYLTGTLLVASAAHAQDFGTGLANLGASQLLENQQGAYNHWNGIGRLESVGNSRCSAVLLDTRAAGNPDDAPAYLLTSGHCAYTSPGMIAHNLPIRGHVEFNYFKDTAGQRQVYALKQLAWSSQHNIDLALIELAVPLKHLLDEGVQPLKLSAKPAKIDQPILAVGAPETANGYTLRASACTLDAVVDIIEYPYVWNANLRNRCQDVLPGASGSPLLSRDDNSILGITGTTTRGSTPGNQCLKDTPCEVHDGQALWIAEANYASPIERLRNCFTNGRFDTRPAACDMEPGFDLALKNAPYLQAIVNTGNRAWNLPFFTDTDHYYHKFVRSPAQCQNPEGYGTGISARNASIGLPDTLEPGLHQLCLIGVHSDRTALSVNLLSNAFVLPIQVRDAKADLLTVALALTPMPGGKQSIAFQRSHAVPHYTYKFGPPDSTHCNDDQGYKHAFYNFNVSPRLMPARLCTRAWDVAGNGSTPRADLLQVATNND